MGFCNLSRNGKSLENTQEQEKMFQCEESIAADDPALHSSELTRKKRARSATFHPHTSAAVGTGPSAIIAVHRAKYLGLLVWVLTGVVNQTSNRLADVRQLVAFRHRLQELNLFGFQRDFLFCLVFHEVLLAFDENVSGSGNWPSESRGTEFKL
jgi:hypothetical protein